jgi:CheY-like chemotaxis protein
MSLVLIVDDDARIRALMARLIETSGYSAVEAADGKEALAKMRQRRPCVILLTCRCRSWTAGSFAVSSSRIRSWPTCP